MTLRAALIWLLAASSLLPVPVEAGHQVVLVTSRSCEMESISMLDIRKAYFGITVSFGGHYIRALRLNDDEQLNRIFFQSVVSMSERLYERRLLSMALKFGVPRPQEYTSVSRLASDIAAGDCAIAYMWREDADSYSELKAIRLLWQSE